MLREQLQDFAGAISLAATDAPDNYADWSDWTYQSHMEDIKELWSNIRPQLIDRNALLVLFIDEKLKIMLGAFESGETEVGRKAAWDIYNSDMRKL